MKANELMIGDWVVINESHPDCPFTRKVDIGDLSFFTKFEPIPLTAEILEKNGLACGVDHRSGESFIRVDWFRDAYGHIQTFMIKIVNNETHLLKHRVYSASLQFVHQLQHSLRLCGLTELADNFKVE